MQQPISAKIYRDKTTRLTKQAGFFFLHRIFALALILPPIEFILKRVGFFLYRCYFVTNSKYAGPRFGMDRIQSGPKNKISRI